MPSFSDITTLVTPGGTITHGAGNFLLDPSQCSGLGMGQLRAPIVDKGQASGFIFPGDFFESGTHFVLSGVIDTEVIATRNTMMANLKAALRSILTTTGTLSWSTGETATVRCDIGVDFPVWGGSFRKAFVYGLVSASPF